MSETAAARARGWALKNRAEVSPWFWGWWPYLLLQPVLTIAIFIHPSIPFLDAATAGSFLLFVRSHPSARALTAAAALAVSLALVGRSTGVEAIVRAAGFSAVLVLGFLASRPGERPHLRIRSVEAAAVSLSLPVIGYVLLVLRDLHPLTYDPVLARLDSIGPPLAWSLARATEEHGILRAICLAVYYALPLALVVVAEAERPHVSRDRSIFVAAGLAAVLGMLAYQIVPATGPTYAFPGYPGQDPPMGELARAIPEQPLMPRNAMPSLHLTWAFLIAHHATRLGTPIRLMAAVFLALTLVSTMALGEHYAVDLVVAIPFAYAVTMAIARRWHRATMAFVAVASVLLAIAFTTWQR